MIGQCSTMLHLMIIMYLACLFRSHSSGVIAVFSSDASPCIFIIRAMGVLIVQFGCIAGA